MQNEPEIRIRPVPLRSKHNFLRWEANSVAGWSPPWGLLHNFGDKYKPHASTLEPRRRFFERGNRRGMRMTDGNGKAVTRGVTCGDFKLRENRLTPQYVVEKYLARRGANARSFSCVVSDCCGGRPAVYEEESSLAERRHQFGHQRCISCRARALMIVHTRRVRLGFEHRVQ